MKKRSILIILVFMVTLCIVSFIIANNKEDEIKKPPEELPKRILVSEIPKNANILFVSMRYVLNDIDCLDENNEIKENFLNDPECIKKIYNAESNVLSSPRQLYTLNSETGEVIQLTNIDCDFSSSKPVDSTTIMAIGVYSDTDNDEVISTNDETHIFLIKLQEKEVECLTCGLNLTSLNNPDYSSFNNKILFSAQNKGIFHNYLFTLDLDGNLEQITDDDDYMDFDSSWSEDGTKIVFSRLPKQNYPWMIPSQIWLMDADGTNQIKITDGGSNPDNEEPHGPYPIGIDADPDLSPDNKKIVFSRLKTGKENEPFGVYELIILDIETGEEMVLDSSYANMIPEWKAKGILFIRQIGSLSSVIDRRQSMHIYKDGIFTGLEPEPYNVFPIGSNGASWMEFERK